MSVSLKVSFSGEGRERLAQFVESLQPRSLNRLHRIIGAKVAAGVKRHILDASTSRHSSSSRVGANPSGHLGLAAESVAFVSDVERATISITSPGFNRVDGPLEIKPVNGDWLTIPVHALSYGKRVSETENLLGTNLFRPGPKGAKKRVLVALLDDGSFEVMYVLSEGVTIPQDRGLLPSDDEFNDMALAGVDDYVAALQRRRARL